MLFWEKRGLKNDVLWSRPQARQGARTASSTMVNSSKFLRRKPRTKKKESNPWSFPEIYHGIGRGAHTAALTAKRLNLSQCRTEKLRGPYLPPQIELGFVKPISGKPWKSFRRTFQIKIPIFLEEVMPVLVPNGQISHNSVNSDGIYFASCRNDKYYLLVQQ